ncbi:MAG: hypothetical protein HOP19_09075, partial [Acidobacteria bacterium]|nr:hypothetical protein [Acidobacteriota bacterium]
MNQFKQCPKNLIRLASLLLALVSSLTLGVAAQDGIKHQVSFNNNQQTIKIDVQVGQTRIVDFDSAYERVSVSDNKVAEVVPVSDKQILVNGLTFGQVNI